jgi:RHS repeat-associated protein
MRTDPTGAVAQSCTDGPYGDALSCSGPWGTTPLSARNFAGMELDSETGFYHTLNRYYNPKLGSWMTPDPAGMGAADPGDPQSVNRYAYALNNPINLSDPSGLSSGCKLMADPNYSDPAVETAELDGGKPNCGPLWMYGGSESVMVDQTNGTSFLPGNILDSSGNVVGQILFTYSLGKLNLAATTSFLDDMGAELDPSVPLYNGSALFGILDSPGEPSDAGSGTAQTDVQCTTTIMSALSSAVGPFTASTHTIEGGIGVATNVIAYAVGLSDSQFGALVPRARWSMSGGFLGFLGIGPSVHIADPNSWWDRSFAIFHNDPASSSALFTAHMDDGLPDIEHPLGAMEHLFRDIVLPKLGVPRKKC